MTTQPTFAVAVTTAPRRTPTLSQTLVSIERAGFATPLISTDEKSGGPWPALLRALNLLIAERPSADNYCIFQDDIVLPNGLAHWLENTQKIRGRLSITSLFTCARNQQELTSSTDRIGRPRIAPLTRGWFPATDLRQMSLGAQAYIFPVHIARDFAANPPDSAGKTTGADLWVARWLRSKSLPLWLHSPSLCQHIAPEPENSSLSRPAGVLNCRRASAWVSDCEAWERTGGREGIEYQVNQAAKAAVPAG